MYIARSPDGENRRSVTEGRGQSVGGLIVSVNERVFDLTKKSLSHQFRPILPLFHRQHQSTAGVVAGNRNFTM